MPHSCDSTPHPEATSPAAPAGDRDAAGRFAAGNPGGPGNPYARQVARLRSAMLAAVTEEDIHEIVRMLITKARLGDKEAAKLVLQYTIGKPGPAANPDTVDLDEWKQQQQCPSPQELKDGLNRAPAVVAVGLQRGYTVMHVQEFRDQLDAMDDADRADAAPSPNGETDQPDLPDKHRPRPAAAARSAPGAADGPSPNGKSGCPSSRPAEVRRSPASKRGRRARPAGS